MIRFRDALTLARTKLRAKRILLIITVVISGLLFGVLSTAIIIASGITTSTEHFFTKALSGRYLVEAQPNIPNWVYGYEEAFTAPSPELAKKLTAMQDNYIAKQKAVYDKYKLPFDRTAVTPILQPSPFSEKDGTGNVVQVINRDSPVYKEYLQQRQADYITTATNKVPDLKKLARPYGATDYYHNLNTTLQPQATYLKDGKEEIGKKREVGGGNSYLDYLTSNVKDSTYTFTDQTLIQRFMLPENDLRKEHTTAIPVVLTTQEIAKVFGKELGIEKQPSDPAAQVEWVKNLQQKANGYTYSACYRSPGESAIIQKTMQANTEMVAKKNDKNYVAPSLQYNLPTTPCGELTIKKDSRTAQEKKEVAVTESIQKDLGEYQPIEHRLLTFQIVGTFTLSDITAQPQNASAYISFLLGPQYSSAASFIPQQLYDKLPESASHKGLLQKTNTTFADMGSFEAAGIKNTIVSFPTLNAARDFIKKEGCPIASTDCKKPFILSTYGSSYLAIDEISGAIQKIAPIALFIAMGIATIVIWITMARVIIDSRRETAVFRALGAKRRDIISIYLLYSMLVSVLIALFMLIVGFVAASIVDSLYGTDATNLAKVAYGVFDELQPFRFIGINLEFLAALTGCIFLISLIAVLPPLWRNVRRSPIRDMRDE